MATLRRTVNVDGVAITLTAKQLAEIKKEKAVREKYKDDFSKMLLHFGFKKVDTSEWPYPNELCFEHIHFDWFAEILDRGTYSDLWMVGHGLKSGSRGDGWLYNDPEELEREIVKFLDAYDGSQE